MIFDRQQQRLLLEGKEYTFEDISQLIAGGAEAHSSAFWDLYGDIVTSDEKKRQDQCYGDR